MGELFGGEKEINKYLSIIKNGSDNNNLRFIEKYRRGGF